MVATSSSTLAVVPPPRNLQTSGGLAPGLGADASVRRSGNSDPPIGFGKTISEKFLLYLGNRYKSHFMLYFIS